jgi:DNA-binding NarL/FixJ family response regulator
MKCAAYGNKQGVLRAIYRLLGEGLNDDDIAVKLDLTEARVQGCIAWIVHFLELKSRQELVLYASTAV